MQRSLTQEAYLFKEEERTPLRNSDTRAQPRRYFCKLRSPWKMHLPSLAVSIEAERGDGIRGGSAARWDVTRQQRYGAQQDRSEHKCHRIG